MWLEITWSLRFEDTLWTIFSVTVVAVIKTILHNIVYLTNV